jgi:cysteinyl-tRNA synthetase
MALRIFNTQTGEKTELVPIEPGKLRMYVCGITSYAPSHIGHARSAIAFDAIYRWLSRSYAVTYVRNFTDVDDKIINAANAAGEDPMALSERYIAMYHEDLEALRCAPPSVEPRVTKTIPEIIAIIERLIAKGHAYPADGDVYFEVASYPAYGSLSRRTQQDLGDLEAGARVEVDPRKRSPHDFALWKAAKPGEPWWDSPWGKGRPGWHIECSAMSSKYLGEVFDLHGGGKDLLFPHHENEMAQSCAASGKPELAHHWMHNGFVNLMPEQCPKCGENLAAEDTAKCSKCGYVFTDMDLKMSKSRGNFYPIREVLSAYEPEALRLLLLSAHYRSPIAFSHKLLADTERRLDRIYEVLDGIDRYTGENTALFGPGWAETFGSDPRKGFKEAMDDDFNTARALAEVAEVVKVANELLGGTEEPKRAPRDKSRLLGEARDFIVEAGDTLALFREPARTYLERRREKRLAALGITVAEIEALIGERTEARSKKDWKRSDELRDQLKSRGVAVKDSKAGTTWDLV